MADHSKQAKCYPREAGRPLAAYMGMGRGGYYAVDSLSGIYTIVVDHDPRARATLIAVLQYCGALVTGAESSRIALESMRQVKPDVLVVALTMPEREGYGLIRDVRALKPEDGGVVPIVALSEDALPDTSPRGFDAHLARPFDPWALCRVISNLVVARP
jgi:CheY-like chemotaxis protein